MGTKKTTALLLLGAVGVVGAVVIAYRSLLFHGMGGPDACLSEVWEDIPSLSGLRFEIEYVNCDTLSKDEAVSVYVGEAQNPNFSNHKTLLFRYDPGGVGRSSRPTIEASGDRRILISVQEVSSVSFQLREWRNVSFDYRIANNKNP